MHEVENEKTNCFNHNHTACLRRLITSRYASLCGTSSSVICSCCELFSLDHWPNTISVSKTSDHAPFWYPRQITTPHFGIQDKSNEICVVARTMLIQVAFLMSWLALHSLTKCMKQALYMYIQALPHKVNYYTCTYLQHYPCSQARFLFHTLWERAWVWG